MSFKSFIKICDRKTKYKDNTKSNWSIRLLSALANLLAGDETEEICIACCVYNDTLIIANNDGKFPTKRVKYRVDLVPTAPIDFTLHSMISIRHNVTLDFDGKSYQGHTDVEYKCKQTYDGDIKLIPEEKLIEFTLTLDELDELRNKNYFRPKHEEKIFTLPYYPACLKVPPNTDIYVPAERGESDIYPLARRLREIIRYFMQFNDSQLRGSIDAENFIGNFVRNHYVIKTQKGNSEEVLRRVTKNVRRAFTTIQTHRHKSSTFNDWLTLAENTVRRDYLGLDMPFIRFLPNEDQVHAEVAIFLEFYQSSPKVNFHTIGVSKLCCPHCTYLFKKFDVFNRVPGCSGEITKWKFPRNGTVVKKLVELVECSKSEEYVKSVILNIQKNHEAINEAIGTTIRPKDYARTQGSELHTL